MSINEEYLSDSKTKCCGCAACQYICPVNAISMRPDFEGFIYPEVNNDKCIGCNKCISVCSFKNDIQSLKYINDNSEPDCYAVVHKNQNVIRDSRSGGVFTAISDYVLEKHGVVYGAVTMSPEMTVVHRRADNKADRNLMRGSKYVQSDISDCFSQIKKDLESGILVLFSGTSCQVAAIKAVVGEDWPNLFTVDVVCHGVPSPQIWKDYVSYVKKKYRAECIGVDFRNKTKFGWPTHIETIKLKKGKRIREVNSLYYTKLYYSHLIIRQSCSCCPYKCKVHPGDVTIGDYWGIKKAAPEFFSQNGVSLLLLNTEKGHTLFSYTKDAIKYRKTELSKSMQPPFEGPFPLPANRDAFWNDYKNMKFESVLLKYVGENYKLRISIWRQRALFLIKNVLNR